MPLVKKKIILRLCSYTILGNNTCFGLVNNQLQEPDIISLEISIKQKKGY